MPAPDSSQKPAWRAAAHARLASETCDLLIIGGGINGAGIARDAALRGLSVALIERDDFASGTSSRSSRLIHGGVRYLEHGFLHLVFEASRERRTLLRIAPHLVTPLKFTWPVYRGARLPRWKILAGLWLYDVLALFRNVGRHRALSADGVGDAEPMLKTQALAGGASYFDAATDDVLLTLSNVVDAHAAGAVVLNHAEVSELVVENGRAAGATVRDRLSGASVTVRARAVVNAAGPWTDAISKLESPASGGAVLGTKGTHVAVPRERVGNRGAVTMLSPTDGRVMFVLPAGEQTIIGTTDTETDESPDEVRASRADVQYLLDAANAYFPAAKLTPDDVVAAWAGIRPLIASGNTRSPAQASREHAIATGPRGVIQVTGGKLTTYRAMSEEVVNVVQKRLGRPLTPASTSTRMLPPVAREFACSVADVLVRRTKRAFATRDHGRSEAAALAAELSLELGWSAPDQVAAVAAYETEIARIFTIEQ